MNDLDSSAFITLFNEASEKCFGHVIKETLTEPEGKLFAAKIFDQTGLVIGPKSIKNYSQYVLNPANKDENPSVATLDTLARYVLNAPYTDEIQRKNKESHYPYWFQYKDKFHRAQKQPKSIFWPAILFLMVALATIIIIGLISQKGNKQSSFTDDFHSLDEDSLNSRGWIIQSRDETHWQKRNQLPGLLTLFTLNGDNWPDSLHQPAIKNLLLRKISSDCFTAETHLSGFMPFQNWQQAGILLLEDTSFTGKSLRLSFSYNDFAGGFPKSREIIVQAITSNGKYFDKPEEVAHQVIFQLDSSNEALVRQNLLHSALRIEKQGNKFRLLYANGSMTNSAFKEIGSHEVEMRPRFIGLFALKGFVDGHDAIPARFDFFRYYTENCEK